MDYYHSTTSTPTTTTTTTPTFSASKHYHSITTTTTTPPSPPQNITTSPPVEANQSIVTNETTQIPSHDARYKVVSAVDGSANALANDGITSSNSITFVLSAFAGVEAADINNFECSTDGSSFSACTQPCAI